jgi:hypothetical protein
LGFPSSKPLATPRTALGVFFVADPPALGFIRIICPAEIVA